MQPSDNVCTDSWNKAFDRTITSLNWSRTVNSLTKNSTGRVQFSEYCAEKGSKVHIQDVRYCCSKQGRSLNILEAGFRNTANLLVKVEDQRICH